MTSNRLAVASRANVPPFHVMDLLAAAGERQRTHGDLVNFVAGQPSTGAPGPVNREAIRLLESGDPLGYTVATRSEEHTSELQSLMRISYAVFCLKKKKNDTM